ncbi:MAG: DoxX family protein [Betaproteobacteria bacterium]|nr:DoxX family protein [Betaproteobacteria bacterium]
MRQYAPLAGRVPLAVIFLISGFGKITGFAGTASFMASKGMPFAEVLLAGALVFELAGAVMLILGWRARWGALLLIVFMIPATLIFHNFWAVEVAQYRNQLNHFLKNVAMIGGLLYVMAFGAGPLSLDAPAKREAGRT